MEPLYTSILFYGVCPLLALLIIVLNTAAIVTIVRIKGKRMLSCTYLLNLSVSDLMTGINVIAITILKLVNSPKVKFLDDILMYTILRLSILMSTFCLIIITFYRYTAVVKPFRYRQMKQRYAICVCVALWVFACTIVAVLKIVVSLDTTKHVQLYLDMMFPILAFPTSCILSFGYYQIVRTLRQQKHRHKRDDGLTKLIVWIIVAYVLCWFPISIATTWIFFGVNKRLYDIAFDTFFCVALFNSCINPIIYLKHLRQNVNEVFRNVKRKISRPASGPSVIFTTKRKRSRRETEFSFGGSEDTTTTGRCINLELFRSKKKKRKNIYVEKQWE